MSNQDDDVLFGRDMRYKPPRADLLTSRTWDGSHGRMAFSQMVRTRERNFTEFVATGYSDIRPPRDGERDTQVLLRTPASWIRGHMTEIESRRVLIYITFWTDRSMSYKQLKDVRSFAKFADERMSKR